PHSREQGGHVQHPSGTEVGGAEGGDGVTNSPTYDHMNWSTKAGAEPSIKQTLGFFTDTSVCIGCKACEVACKEWNGVPDDGFRWSGKSYDNTLALGHSTWRHVKFVEREPEVGRGGNVAERMTWEFSSDVCKHCENAGCLEACPTG